jgi:phosphatidylinositol alpha 1,6-mannosyltransferase
MRVALFSEVFLPKMDGVVNTICHLLDHLAQAGHNSLLVAPGDGIHFHGQTRVLGLKSFAVPFYPELHLAPPWARIAPDLDQFQPELVHVINPVSLGISGIRYARSRHIPLVASYHTDLPGFAARWGLGFLRSSLWAYQRIIHNLAHINLAPSKFTRIELVDQKVKRVYIWSRGVNIEQFSPTKRSEIWRERMGGGDSDSKLLLYVGRLSAEKRIAALRPLLDVIPGVRLAIVGDGPQRSELQMFFAGTPTVFMGFLRGDDLAHAYASSDIFVFPGINETFGNVVLEAMASGLPVVVPDAGGMLDFTRHGFNGLVFSSRHPQSLVDAVKLLLSNPTYARQLGCQARNTAEQKSWFAVMDSLINAYHRAIILESRRHRLKHSRLENCNA